MKPDDPFKIALRHLDFSWNMIRAFGHSANKCELPGEVVQLANWILEYLLALEDLNRLQMESLGQEVERLSLQLDNIVAALRAEPGLQRDAVRKSHARRRAALKVDRPLSVKGAPGKVLWPPARPVARAPDSDKPGKKT